jgi:hypothetical protein
MGDGQRRSDAMQFGNFKPLTSGEMHAARNSKRAVTLL